MSGGPAMNAIEVHGVSKTYRIPHERRTTLAEQMLSLFRPSGVEEFLALSHVSVDIPPGEFVGIIGANGSGKSTLLKVLAGLILPDEGEVRVNGTLVPLLELGLGFQQELSVQENVSLYGAVLGYPRREMAKRVDEVVAFAGLDRFRDAKLKSLSSGMLMRLAFATALRADADILLLDEVLAVGDVEFQQKCFEVFEELKRQRKTIVLVSHDLGSVQRFCDRALWLDKGRLVMTGDANQVVQTYLGLFRSHEIRQATGQDRHGWTKAEASRRAGDGRLRYLTCRLEGEDGTALVQVRSGQVVILRAVFEVSDAVIDPVFWFGVKQLGSLGGHTVYSTSSQLLGQRTGTLTPGSRVEVCFPFTAALMNSQYQVNVAALQEDGTLHDWVNECASFTVEGSACWDGVADLMASFRCRTTDAGEGVTDEPAAGSTGS